MLPGLLSARSKLCRGWCLYLLRHSICLFGYKILVDYRHFRTAVTYRGQPAHPRPPLRGVLGPGISTFCSLPVWCRLRSQMTYLPSVIGFFTSDARPHPAERIRQSNDKQQQRHPQPDPRFSREMPPQSRQTCHSVRPLFLVARDSSGPRINGVFVECSSSPDALRKGKLCAKADDPSRLLKKPPGHPDPACGRRICFLFVFNGKQQA